MGSDGATAETFSNTVPLTTQHEWKRFELIMNDVPALLLVVIPTDGMTAGDDAAEAATAAAATDTATALVSVGVDAVGAPTDFFLRSHGFESVTSALLV
jgi:hypothetical protein